MGMAEMTQDDWYDLIEEGTLEQGDILFQCPVSVLVSDTLPSSDEEEIEVDLLTLNVVVMTQSCDLANGKTPDVVLCALWNAEEAISQGVNMGQKNTLAEIKKGRRPRYVLLNKSTLLNTPLSLCIADCGKVFSLPLAYVQDAARRQGPRLRLRSPYREHLSQAFAQYFMRVGLPKDIDLP